MSRRASKILAAVVATCVGIPLGFALGHSEEPSSPLESTSLETTSEDQPAEAYIPLDEAADLPQPAAPPPGPGAEATTVHVIGDTLPPEVLDQCQTTKSSDPACEVARAMDADAIEPGRYTDEELNKALEQAGYQGGF